MEVSDRADEYFQTFHKKGILEVILKNIESRRNAAQVNKAFYDAVCKLDNKDDIFKVALHKLDENFPLMIDSFECSKRAVSAVEISDNYFVTMDNVNRCIFKVNEVIFDHILRVLVKFSGSIKKLTFTRCLFNAKQFIDVLMAVNESALEELNLDTCGIFNSGPDIYPSELRLPSLKVINMPSTNFGHPYQEVEGENLITQFFASLPSYCKLEKFVALPTILDMMPLDKFYFDSLGILNNAPFRMRIPTAVCRQYRVRELNLSSTFIMDDVINEVLSLEYLESLKINCQAISIKAFSKVCKMENLTALHLEVNARQTWVPNALHSFAFANITKLSIDVSQMVISMESLRDMFRARIRELEVKTSQRKVIEGVFSSPCCLSVHTLKIEFVFNPRAIYKPDPDSDNALMRNNRRFSNLKSLTIINHIPELAGCTADLVKLLERFAFLRKIHLEGFMITETLHSGSLTFAKGCLEELTLIDLLNYPGYEPAYVIPPVAVKGVNKNKKLKKMIVTATQNFYDDYGRFPVIKKVNSEFVFCYR